MLKRCGCQREYDEDKWGSLRLVGGYDPDNSESPERILEMRDCTCGSTIVIARYVSEPLAKKAACDALTALRGQALSFNETHARIATAVRDWEIDARGHTSFGAFKGRWP